MFTQKEIEIILNWLNIVNYEHGEENMTDEEKKLKEKLEKEAKKI